MWVLNCTGCANALCVNWGGWFTARYADELRQIAEGEGWRVTSPVELVTMGSCPDCAGGDE